MASPRYTYLDREQHGDDGTMTAEEPLPRGWAALAILGLSAASWALIGVAFWLY